MEFCTACQSITLKKLTTPLKNRPLWMEERAFFEKIYSKNQGMIHLQNGRELAVSAENCALCALIHKGFEDSREATTASLKELYNDEADEKVRKMGYYSLRTGPILLCPVRHNQGKDLFLGKKRGLGLSGLQVCLLVEDKSFPHHKIDLSLYADEGIPTLSCEDKLTGLNSFRKSCPVFEHFLD
jgi:hypothetical protein